MHDQMNYDLIIQAVLIDAFFIAKKIGSVE